MASSLRKPEILSFEGNVPENLRIFFMEFNIYVDAAHPTATDATKIKIMLTWQEGKQLSVQGRLSLVKMKTRCQTGNSSFTGYVNP